MKTCPDALGGLSSFPRLLNDNNYRPQGNIMTTKILVIEDDQDINNLVTMNLNAMHQSVTSCHDGLEGLEKALSASHDLIVLDLMLPNMDGLEICRRLRASDVYTPILMLTARDSEADRVIGLEMGADDYLTKPFSIRELQARVKAMLRRVALLKESPSEETLSFHDLEINVGQRIVTLANNAIELTTTEFDLLTYMARRPGHAFSRAQLLDGVWGYQHSGYEHTVNSHINRLRNKLETDLDQPQRIKTVWGVGYKFVEA
ncbi:response regulator transcription factor [Litoribacillus peritrichatus]|uniref:Response regulator transcription factor n=1 Tax=Litoribacillus peritrichatus TaxID=718191 RepID=A0ABP7MQ67_9GAMM